MYLFHVSLSRQSAKMGWSTERCYRGVNKVDKSVQT